MTRWRGPERCRALVDDLDAGAHEVGRSGGRLCPVAGEAHLVKVTPAIRKRARYVASCSLPLAKIRFAYSLAAYAFGHSPRATARDSAAACAHARYSLRSEGE
jgi:hypothetical protein